eukprot:snap_masked-scaffold_7-processed-gene-19.5-mRNA-1 protein AED:1.00 eAED:1.00 QI:0/-1/0/0/-1/1/1/0/136
MEKFGLNETLLVEIVADNTNTNKRVWKYIETQFVRCISHHVALGVIACIKSNEELAESLDKVQLLFRKVKKSKKLTAALSELTKKVAILSNVTRWSGKFLMMKRYLEIWMFCAQLDDEVGALILGEDERKTLGKYV